MKIQMPPLWKSSYLATLFTPSRRWEAWIQHAVGKPAALLYQHGKERKGPKARQLLLSEVVKCEVVHGWFWSRLELTKKGGGILLFVSLRKDDAKAFSSLVTNTILHHIDAELLRHQALLSQHLDRIKSFKPKAPVYAAISELLAEESEKCKQAILDANGISGHVYVRRFRKKAGEQIVQLSVFLDEVLTKLKRDALSDLSCHLTDVKNELEPFVQQIKQFMCEDHYLRYSRISRFAQCLAAESEQLLVKAGLLTGHPYAIELDKQRQVVVRLAARIHAYSNPEYPTYSWRNEKFVCMEKESGNPALSKLNSEQQTAAVVFEDRNLLVAAAGSGKSWTLIGKIGYALTRNLFAPSKIIALAFNSEAADELNKKINKELRPLLGKRMVKAHTFHALGMAILRKANKKKQRIRIFGSSRKGQRGDDSRAKQERVLLTKIVSDLKANSPEFLSNWLLFLTLCRQPSPTADTFESYKNYAKYVEEQRRERKKGEPAFLQAMDGCTIVRSVEELAICNWLWMNSVRYVYEQDFQPKPPNWDKFNPDFYFPDIDTWHEHFGLDEYGRAPPYFKDPKWYAQQATAKEDWFEQHVAGRWFSTRSADYRNGKLFERLRSELTQRGIHLVPRSFAQVDQQVKTLRQKDVFNLISRALHIVRGNGYSRADFDSRYAGSDDLYRSKCFATIFWPIHDAYAEVLRQKREVDFDDMIVKAAEALERKDVLLPYSLIMVDEFQDLSPGRARLVTALLNQQPNDSVLFAVGDDWQAINGFAGSDLSLFMGFEATFGRTWEGPLSTTFRCNQGLADVSSSFVMENRYQKRKAVQASSSQQTMGVIDLIDFSNDESERSGTLSEIERIIAKIAADLEPPDPNDKKARKTSVYVLGRYQFDNMACLLPESGRFAALAAKHADVLDLTYKTAHASKGLEADYVFCVGLNRSKFYNFPSTFTTDPLISMLLASQDEYPYAEERRLFYVAMTRARQKAYLMFQCNSASSFVVELMSERYSGQVLYRGSSNLPPRCPSCGNGFLLPRQMKDGSEKLGCSGYRKNDPWACRYMEALPTERKVSTIVGAG